MKVVILSDIHDHIWNLDRALELCRDCGVLICCGDLCAPFIMKRLAEGFAGDIHVVFGNNDADLFRITRTASGYGERVKLHGEWADVEIGGKRFGVNHFDYIAREIAPSGHFDVICFGHNHIREITQVGATLLLNPGPVMGVKFDQGTPVATEASFMIYDTESGETDTRFIPVPSLS
ncbi:MAG: metallophosphoesterase [Bacteroidetes bacterium]|nr:MAG: metallophosphoesterase [Bacteroidota bacterium]